MKVKVVLLSGTLGLSGSTTWINNLSVGLSRLGIDHVHLVVGARSLFDSSSDNVLYTGRSRSSWYIKFLRFAQFHKIFKNKFSKVEASFFRERSSKLLNKLLEDRVLIIKDFNSYLPDFFLSSRFVIVDVLHNNVSALELKKYRGILVTVSEVVRQRSNKLGYHISKTIYNPVDEIGLVKKSAEYTVSCASPYIVYVGSLSKEKGVFDLLEAYASTGCLEIRKRNLVFVGKGDSSNDLYQRVVEMGLEERVVFTGLLENPYPWIAQADLLVLPSYAEVMPYAPIEASVLGTSYLVADFESAHEFFPPNNIFHTSDSSKSRVEHLEKAMSKALFSQCTELLPGLKDSIRPEVVASKYYNLLD